MKLEQKCISLEIAKKMKAMGFPQRGYFYWCIDPHGIKEPFLYSYRQAENGGFTEKYAAFDVAELGGMLPAGKVNESYIISYHPHRDCYIVDLYNFTAAVSEKSFSAPIEPDARAEMLMWCAENGMVDITRLY